MLSFKQGGIKYHFLSFWFINYILINIEFFKDNKTSLQKYTYIYFTSAYIYIYIYIYKLATIVEGDPKAPFSIATTPRCSGGRYSFPWFLHFTLDPYHIMLSVKQGNIKYHF